MPSATLPPVTAASATLPPVTAATTSQPSDTYAVKQFHSDKTEPVVFQIGDKSSPPLPSANISIASSSNNCGVSLNQVGGGCEDNAVLYTTRRDYLKPTDVFATLDKPDTTKISTMPPIKPKAGANCM